MRSLVGSALFSAMLWSMMSSAVASQELAQKHNCLSCHQVDKKVVGPAFQDVAKKYKGQADAATKLAEKVKKGGAGVWGQVPMPPNAQVPEADIKILVKWMLSQTK